jgi:hypothetical protein
MLPLMRRFVRPRVKTILKRDEELQARSLLRQLELLDSAGVDGTFVYTFTAPRVGAEEFIHGRRGLPRDTIRTAGSAVEECDDLG